MSTATRSRRGAPPTTGRRGPIAAQASEGARVADGTALRHARRAEPPLPDADRRHSAGGTAPDVDIPSHSAGGTASATAVPHVGRLSPQHPSSDSTLPASTRHRAPRLGTPLPQPRHALRHEGAPPSQHGTIDVDRHRPSGTRAHLRRTIGTIDVDRRGPRGPRAGLRCTIGTIDADRHRPHSRSARPRCRPAPVDCAIGT